MPEKKETRGGKRENQTGRPPINKVMSIKVKNSILKTARKLAKKHGRTIEEAMFEMIYDKDIQDTVKASVFKIYIDAMVAKTSEQTVVTKDDTPRIYLPEKLEDPAFRVVKGGK